MPKFNITHETTKTPDDAYQAVKNLISGKDELSKFDSKAKTTFNDSSKTCQIKGSQFSADMSIAPSNKGSKVTIAVDLSFLLTPFKGKVEEILQKMLGKHLG